MLIKIYVSGLLVLIGAIAFNSLAKLVKLPSWYDFLTDPKLGFVSGIWLFLVYPFLLGIVVYFIKVFLFEKF
jgi:hypothetical protein